MSQFEEDDGFVFTRKPSGSSRATTVSPARPTQLSSPLVLPSPPRLGNPGGLRPKTPTPTTTHNRDESATSVTPARLHLPKRRRDPADEPSVKRPRPQSARREGTSTQSLPSGSPRKAQVSRAETPSRARDARSQTHHSVQAQRSPVRRAESQAKLKVSELMRKSSRPDSLSTRDSRDSRPSQPNFTPDRTVSREARSQNAVRETLRETVRETPRETSQQAPKQALKLALPQVVPQSEPQSAPQPLPQETVGPVRSTTPENVAVGQVDLPAAETPVIRRNQRLRQSSRRSSLSQRGKRMSTVGNGFVADPHADVDARDFYKHSEAETADPQRLKQVLVWCLKRKLHEHGDSLKQLRERGGAASEQQTALTIARQIEEEVVQGLVDGQISVDWLHGPPRNEPDVRPVKVVPNAQNTTNKSNLAAFESRLAELAKEKQALQAQLDSLSRPRVNIAALDAKFERVFVPTLNPEVQHIIHHGVSEAAQETRELISRASDQILFTLLRLEDGLHKVGSLAKASRVVVDRQMVDMSRMLVQKQEAHQQVPTHSILRALSRLR